MVWCLCFVAQAPGITSFARYLMVLEYSNAPIVWTHVNLLKSTNEQDAMLHAIIIGSNDNNNDVDADHLSAFTFTATHKAQYDHVIFP